MPILRIVRDVNWFPTRFRLKLYTRILKNPEAYVFRFVPGAGRG